ncbi:MAG: hypothetical protein GXP62_07400 [Oligoflexia bacterium]|nr:hypothetical protein [Oligoflexia bacterium]
MFNSLISSLFALALGLAAALPPSLAWAGPGDETATPAQPAMSPPALESVRPFFLGQSTIYKWSADGRPVDQGYVLVLGVDPELARPRQGPHPVLYVGDTPAERLSWSSTAPNLVVLIPGPIDLTATPVFWGDETLPERVDATHGATVLATAGAAVKPYSASQLAAATGPAYHVADIAALYAAVEPLVQEVAPLDGPSPR